MNRIQSNFVGHHNTQHYVAIQGQYSIKIIIETCLLNSKLVCAWSSFGMALYEKRMWPQKMTYIMLANNYSHELIALRPDDRWAYSLFHLYCHIGHFGLNFYHIVPLEPERVCPFWPTMTKESNWHIDYFESMEALHSNWHFSWNNQYICQLLCFVMVGRMDIYGSGSKGTICITLGLNWISSQLSCLTKLIQGSIGLGSLVCIYENTMSCTVYQKKLILNTTADIYLLFCSVLFYGCHVLWKNGWQFHRLRKLLHLDWCYNEQCNSSNVYNQIIKKCS